MITTVYRIPTARSDEPSSSLLVCHLRDTSPEEAIAKLDRAGVLAIPGPDPLSIVLVGYRREVADLLQDFRIHGHDYRVHSHWLIGKLRRLALSA